MTELGRYLTYLIEKMTESDMIFMLLRSPLLIAIIYLEKKLTYICIYTFAKRLQNFCA